MISRRTRDMDYMWDDLVSVCTTTPVAHSVQQCERCPGRVCRSASRDTYDAEVCHGGEILYFVSASTKKKGGGNEKSIETLGGGRGGKRERGKKKYLTGKRRPDFSPADISKVQQHALLQRVEHILSGYRIWRWCGDVLDMALPRR
jgi:hypothetical protein